MTADPSSDPQRLWRRVRDGLPTAVFGRLPEPPPDLHLLRVSCDVAPAELRPLIEARRRAEAILDESQPLLDQARERVVSGLRRRLLGEAPERPSEAVLVEVWNNLAKQAGHRWALVFEAVEAADAATLASLAVVLRRPGWLQLPLVLVFRGEPEGAAAEVLEALRGHGGEEAVLRGEVSRAAPEPAVDWHRLPAPVLRVLRAGALVGPGFEAEVVGALLGQDAVEVIERLQEAADFGVPLEDRGDGVFSLPGAALSALAQTILPSLAQAWHRRLGRLLSARAQEADEAVAEAGERGEEAGRAGVVEEGREVEGRAGPAIEAARAAARGGEGRSGPAIEGRAGPAIEAARAARAGEGRSGPAIEVARAAVRGGEGRSGPAIDAARVGEVAAEPAERAVEHVREDMSDKAGDGVTAPAVPPGLGGPAEGEGQFAGKGLFAGDSVFTTMPVEQAEDEGEEAAGVEGASEAAGVAPESVFVVAPAPRVEARAGEPSGSGGAVVDPAAIETATRAAADDLAAAPEFAGPGRAGGESSRTGSSGQDFRSSQARTDPLIDAVRAAEHLRLAGELDAAAERYVAAARAAGDAGAPQAAAQHARRALALLGSLPASPGRKRLKVRGLIELGRVQWQAVGPELGWTLTEALATLEAARQEVGAGDPLALYVELCQAVAGVCFDLGDLRSLERALEELAAASRALHAAGDATGAARLLNDQAAVYVRLGDPVRALHLLRESRRVFEAGSKADPVVLRELAETDHLFARIPLHAQLRPGREQDGYAMGLDHALAAERAYRQLGDTRELGRVWETMGRLELHKGRLERATGRLQAALEVQMQIGDLTGLARTTEALSEVLAAAGRDAEALTLLRDSVLFNREKGSPLGLAFNRRSFLGLAKKVAADERLAGALRELAELLDAAEGELGALRLPGEGD